jgi:hypothetical protein
MGAGKGKRQRTSGQYALWIRDYGACVSLEEIIAASRRTTGRCLIPPTEEELQEKRKWWAENEHQYNKDAQTS